MTRAVRGATIVENNEDSIRSLVVGLIGELMQRNGITEEDLISIIFSQTPDVDAMNPATALRSAGYAGVPLFCTQAPVYRGSYPGLIRVLLTCETQRRVLEPVYRNGAERLRSDLFKRESLS
jgi:chorismate mutase